MKCVMKNLQYVMVIVLDEFAVYELTRIKWIRGWLLSFWGLEFVTAAANGRDVGKVECLAKETRGKTYWNNQMAGPLKH